MSTIALDTRRAERVKPELREIMETMSPEQKNATMKVVLNYASPESCSDWFGYVLSRIWNAVKSVFGCSDWQNAHALLYKGFDEGLKGSEMPERVISVIRSELFNPVVDNALELFVAIQGGKAEKEAKAQCDVKNAEGLRRALPHIVDALFNALREQAPEAARQEFDSRRDEFNRRVSVDFEQRLRAMLPR